MEEFFDTTDDLDSNVSGENLSTLQKLRKLISENIKRLYYSNIPDENIKEMKPIFAKTYGAIAYATTIAFFIFFAYLSYSSNISQDYISLTFDPKQCSTVPIQITSTFNADNNGNWIGSAGFRYPNMLYHFEFNGLRISTISQYEKMMDTFYADILRIGNMAKTTNLALNLLLWTTYRSYYSLDSQSLVLHPSDSQKGGLQKFQMSGDVKRVFNLKYQAVRVMGPAGFCGIIPSTTFSEDSGIISGSINANDFNNDPICSNIMDPEYMGWNRNFDGYNFTLGLDVQSFVIAMAVNLGYFSLDTLEIAYDLGWTFATPTSANESSNSYEANFYYDSRYPSMNLILCLRNVTVVSKGSMTTLCLLQINQIIFGLPIFTSHGLWSDQQLGPIPCNCSLIEADSNLREACDLFSLLSGYVIFETYDESLSDYDNVGNQLYAYYLLVDKYSSYADLNDAMRDALEVAAAFTAEVEYDDYASIMQYLLPNYILAPCYISNDYNTTCSIVMFLSHDFINNQVSEFHYQLRNGACSDTLSIPRDKWKRLVDTPPVKFYQDFYTCKPDPLTTAQAALGVASGNLSVTVPIVLAILLPLVFLLLQCLDKVPLEDIYGKEDEEKALQVVAGMMLRLRDRRAVGLRPNSILQLWYSELTESAQVSLYRELMYPDQEQKQHCVARAVTADTKVVLDYNGVNMGENDDL